MNQSQPLTRLSWYGSILAFMVLGVIWGGILGRLHLDGRATILDPLENLTADWRFVLTGPSPPPSNVVIAAIDDKAVRAAGGYPLPRGVLARAIRALAEQHPAAIAVDLLFLDPGDPATDKVLADSLRDTPSVVGAAGFFASGSQQTAHGPIPEPDGVLWPVGEIGTAARAGLVNIATDESGVPRFVPLIFRSGGTILPALTLRAVALASGEEVTPRDNSMRIGGRAIGLDLGYHLPLRFYGPRGTIQSFSAAALARGGPAPDRVRGKVVVLGVTAVGVGDTYATPYDRVVPGAEILATAIANLLSGGGLTRTTTVRRLDAAAMVVLPAACVALLGLFRPVAGAAAATLLVLCWLVATLLAWRQGYWFAVAGPLAALIPVVGLYLATRAILLRRSARRVARDAATLARFQPAGLVRALLADPAFLEHPISQPVAVVFLDLSGFTGLAETMGPEASRELLAGFHAIVDRDVEVAGGVVVSFMGDGAMILFGLPAARTDDPIRALRCVATLSRSTRLWRETLPAEAAAGLTARIGAHFGPAVISRLGSSQYQHVTATGDTVNVTSRLLEVAKQLGGGIVVSEDVWRVGGAARCGTAGPVIEQAIRGRARPVLVRSWRPDAGPAPPVG